MSDFIFNSARTAIESGAKKFEEAGVYFGHGTNNAIDEAYYIVSYALGCSPVMPEQQLDSVLTEKQIKIITSIYNSRIEKKIPVAYLTNEAWFCGYKFYIDERVLVPRSPFAELIDEQFSPWINWLDSGKDKTVLDLCTGSACIAIAIALNMPNVQVHASDISDDALAVATININNFKLSNSVQLIKSNIFEDIVVHKYDLIVSNPPYVNEFDMSNLAQEYLSEPKLGLQAGPNGLDIVIPMLTAANDYLTESGLIIVEVGNSATDLQDMFPEVPFTWLEFEYGGQGVFLLEANQIRKYHSLFCEKC